MRIIAVANHKGGCGKTTTAVNLAAAFAQRGNRVLVVDLDSQGHATLGFGVNPYEIEHSIYEILLKRHVSWDSTIIRDVFGGVDLVPSNVLLSGAEVKLANLNRREYVLKQRFEDLNESYDVCLIDCSPSLSVLTLNALVVSSGMIIPVQAQYYAIEGLKQLVETISIVRDRYNPDLRIYGMLLTFVERRTVLSKDIEEQLREYFGDLVFETVIHRAIRLAEAPGMGEPILQYAPESQGALEYQKLAEEIIHGKKETRTTQEAVVNI